MKKETKKKVFNFALATTIVASVATPLAIVLGKESNLLFNKNTKVASTNNNIDTMYINGNDYTLDLTNALSNVYPNNNDRRIKIANPNISKAIPGGYVVVSGNNSNKNQQIICLDSKDPTKQKWTINLTSSGTNTTDINVYGIEYSPASNGTLVVLYSETPNDKEYKVYNGTNNGQTVIIKVKLFKNIDQANLINPPQPLWNREYDYANNDTTNGQQNNRGGRLDTWAISPVYNLNAPVTKFILYCREKNFNNKTGYGRDKRTGFILIDTADTATQISEVLSINWHGETGNNNSQNRKAICSVAAFEYNNALVIAPLIIDFQESKFKLDIYKKQDRSSILQKNTNDNDGWNKQFTSYSISDSNDDRIANIAKGAISSSSIKKTNDGFEIAFAINARPNSNGKSPHRSSGIVVLKLNNELKITDKIEKHLFQQNTFSDDTIENELWNGYFSNEVIAASGINATLNNDYLTPFVGIGWSKVLDSNKPWFVWLLKNPFDSNTFYELSPNTNSNDYRIYRTKNSDFYKNWGTNQPSNQLEFGQLECGIPLLEYNHDSTNSNQPFERNIFLTENNTSKAIMINQKDRESSTANQATYSYHTRFENLTPSFNNFNSSSNQLLDQNIDNVTEQKIQDLINNTNKDTFLRALIARNIVSDATFAIRDIVFNFVSGTINFALDITKYFDERGIFQSGTKTFNVSITAFNKKQKTTISDNVNLNDPTVVYNDIHSYNLIPSISGSRTPIDNKYWNFRFLVLTALKQKQNLFGRSNNFRNVNNLTITEQDFNKVFTRFEITNSNNANGSITVSFTIKKDYVYTDNENLNDIVTFNGLRKINQTELISNNKETPLEIQSLSTINMPYNGNSWQYPTYTQGIQTITEDQLKQKLIEEVFNKDYANATSTNGFDSGISNLTKHLPFLKTYKDQDANNITNSEIITKNNIVLSNYEFFAAKGILKVDVQLNVWNGTDNKLKHTERLGIEDANAPIQEAPKATWYISGFKHDNVETKFNSETVWELSGLSLIKPNQFEENKDTVKESLLNCLKANQNLISFPYWVNKEEVLKTIDIEFDPDCKIDTTDKKQALLKVRFNNNMWEADEQGKVSEKTTDAKLQTIKITGFLNPEPIKLQSEKLKNIRLSGNTKVLTIDENETQTFEGVDQERKQYLEIQYSVEGLNEWFTKEAFIEKLNQLNGSLDNENWIIKREDIKARYGLKQEYNNGNILIDVDGFITDNNEELTTQKTSIIDDTYNNTVKGYINIDKITEQFKAENFEVRGTDKSPKLVIKNVNELNALFSRYASNNIFEILYSNNQNEINFDSNNAIWNNATTALEEKITLQNGPYTNQFSLVFKGTTNYEVYKNGQKENNGYILKTPSIKMVISIEIDNPLNNKDVKFNFKNKDNPNTAHFYQNKGGFSVKIGDKNSTNNLQEFNDFINTLFSSDQGKKDSLELAYYVSRYKLTDEELIRIHQEDLYKEIVDQNQKYDVWKTLDTTNWQNNLGLLVNDYVVVTVRVKKDKLPTDDKSGYEIKYADDYIPFQSRVYGYKIKASEIQINENSISLVNVGQAESAPYALDGYARLKHLSLVEDQNKNYLGASIKINYFNEFYKGSESQILTSGSGQVLVRRETGTDKKEYKDENGNQIQSNGSPIYLELKNGIPTAPTKLANVQNTLELEEYSINSFRFKNFEAKELKYNFFQNQEIEFEISNKKGLATGNDEFDYYLDNGTQKIKYTFKDIKFPINNDSNIRYQFETKEFMEQISNLSAYQNSSDPLEDPVNGQSKLVAKFKVTRSENKKESHTFNDLEEINRQIRTDFGGQVKLVATYTSTDGRTEKIDGGDISTIGTLKNGDRFKIEIVSTSDDLIFAQQPSPLIFAVSGLYEKPIDQELLKYLRVKQGGTIDGQGSFNILVDDPNQSNSNSDIKTLLGGYKFLVRVWDETKKIKHDWTENFISINNLNNGDKVEWKLVSPNGSPLKPSYYNTIANPDKHNANEKIYSFIQINQKGFAGQNISEPIEGVGQHPEDPNAYPETSGLLISGLKSRDDSSYTTIDDSEFRRVMNLMNFSYSGINGQGNMVSSKNASDIKLNVVGRNSETFTLDYLIKNNYLSFYCNNTPFNWNQVKDENGNWLTSPGTLKNGDIVEIRYKDPTISDYYSYTAPVVSGLQNKSDNMSMFSWIGIGIASFVTLGIFALIYIHARNKKLK